MVAANGGQDHVKPTPVLPIVSVLDERFLLEGVVQEDERHSWPGAYVPPSADKGQALAEAFLGLLVNDDLIRRELTRAADSYPFPVRHLGDLLGSHLFSWDAWEPCTSGEEPDPRNLTPSAQAATALVRIVEWRDLPSDSLQVGLLPLPPEYRESILHLCASLRMGRIWPRLLHGAVIAYTFTKGDAEGPRRRDS